MNDSDHGCVVRIFVGPSYCCTGNQRQRAIEQWRPMTRQKRLYLHHQGEFQHNYFVVVSLHHGDHYGAVRIFVGHSEVVKRLLFTLFIYAAQFFSYQECNPHSTEYTKLSCHSSWNLDALVDLVSLSLMAVSL